jgi:hypothetical protein
MAAPSLNVQVMEGDSFWHAVSFVTNPAAPIFFDVSNYTWTGVIVNPNTNQVSVNLAVDQSAASVGIVNFHATGTQMTGPEALSSSLWPASGPLQGWYSYVGKDNVGDTITALTGPIALQRQSQNLFGTGGGSVATVATTISWGTPLVILSPGPGIQQVVGITAQGSGGGTPPGYSTQSAFPTPQYATDKALWVITDASPGQTLYQVQGGGSVWAQVADAAGAAALNLAAPALTTGLTGLTNAIETEAYYNGVTPDSTTPGNAAALNTLIASLPQGSTVKLSQTNQKPTKVFVESAVDFHQQVELRGSAPGRLNIVALPPWTGSASVATGTVNVGGLTSLTITGGLSQGTLNPAGQATITPTATGASVSVGTVVFNYTSYTGTGPYTLTGTVASGSGSVSTGAIVTIPIFTDSHMIREGWHAGDYRPIRLDANVTLTNGSKVLVDPSLQVPVVTTAAASVANVESWKWGGGKLYLANTSGWNASGDGIAPTSVGTASFTYTAVGSDGGGSYISGITLFAGFGSIATGASVVTGDVGKLVTTAGPSNGTTPPLPTMWNAVISSYAASVWTMNSPWTGATTTSASVTLGDIQSDVTRYDTPVGLSTFSTALASSMNGLSLPQSSVSVATIVGAPSSGVFLLNGSLLAYASVTGGTNPTFNNCTGGTGVLVASVNTVTMATTAADAFATTTDLGKGLHGGGLYAGTQILAVTPGVGYVLNQAYAGPGITNAVVRVGHGKHRTAPSVTNPMALNGGPPETLLFYPQLSDICVDINGNSGVTGIGLVHVQERAILDNLIVQNTLGANKGWDNITRAIFSNNEISGNAFSSGPWYWNHFVMYSTGWESDYRADGTNGGTGSFYIRDHTLFDDCGDTGPADASIFNDSPYYVRAFDAYKMYASHEEALGPNWNIPAWTAGASIVAGQFISQNGSGWYASNAGTTGASVPPFPAFWAPLTSYSAATASVATSVNINTLNGGSASIGVTTTSGSISASGYLLVPTSTGNVVHPTALVYYAAGGGTGTLTLTGCRTVYASTGTGMTVVGGTATQGPIIIPTNRGNAEVFMATTSGTSAATPPGIAPNPQWTNLTGATNTDGTVVWTSLAYSEVFDNGITWIEQETILEDGQAWTPNTYQPVGATVIGPSTAPGGNYVLYRYISAGVSGASFPIFPAWTVGTQALDGIGGVSGQAVLQLVSINPSDTAMFRFIDCSHPSITGYKAGQGNRFFNGPLITASETSNAPTIFPATSPYLRDWSIPTAATTPARGFIIGDLIRDYIAGRTITYNQTSLNPAHLYAYDATQLSWADAADNPWLIIYAASTGMQVSVYDPAGVDQQLLGIIAAQTVTNKRITRRVISPAANVGTPAINTDTCDIVDIAPLSTAINTMSTNLTGTPIDGDVLVIRITDNGTPRVITWGTGFEASTVALPITTVGGVMLTCGFQYNGATSKFRIVGIA